LLGLNEDGVGLLALGTTGGGSPSAARSAVGAALGESSGTLAGAGTSMVGTGLSSLVGRRRMATSVATVPITTADTPPIASIEGPLRTCERAGGGGGTPYGICGAGL
jgi:hypothetical protein